MARYDTAGDKTLVALDYAILALLALMMLYPFWEQLVLSVSPREQALRSGCRSLGGDRLDPQGARVPSRGPLCGLERLRGLPAGARGLPIGCPRLPPQAGADPGRARCHPPEGEVGSPGEGPLWFSRERSQRGAARPRPRGRVQQPGSAAGVRVHALDLAEVARAMRIGKGHLCRVFRHELGSSVMQFRDELRINRAAELLRTTDLKVYQIAERVGYDSAEHFSKIFKKRKGRSPARFGRNAPEHRLPTAS